MAKCPKGKKWNRKTQKCIWKRKVVKGEVEGEKRKLVYKKQDPDAELGFIDIKYKAGKGRKKKVYTGKVARYEDRPDMISTFSREK